ncbi:immunoglobulin-like domain-containing protein [Listeria fleischmannii]|nr:immunoglobulin-like domain-containing protein [Listeria fleischmannii]
MPFNVLTAKAVEESVNTSSEGVTSGNLFNNHGFVGSEGTLPGWNVSWTADERQTAYLKDYKFYDMSGQYLENYVTPQSDQSLDLTHKRVTDNGHIAYLRQNINVIPGHRYALSIDYKYVSGAALEKVQFRTIDRRTNAALSDSSWLSADNPVAKTYTSTVTASSNSLRVELKVIGFNDAIGVEGTVNFSNVSIVDLDATDISIGAINTKSTAVTGSATPNAKIDVFAGEEKIGSGTTNEAGEYTISIPQQAKDTVITAKDDTSKLSKTTTVAQGISQTTIDHLEATSTVISGKAEPNANVEVRNSEGTLIASGQANASGAYSFPIARQEFDDTITVTATFEGQTSTASAKVQDTTTPSKPSLNPVTDHDTSISGTGTPGDRIQITIGGQTYTGTIDAAGNFSIVVPKIPGGTTISVVEVNSNNQNRSTPTEVSVRDTTLAEPSIASIKAGDTTVMVTGEPGATVSLTTPSGESITRTADATGKASFTINPAKAGDSFTATQTGANGKASPASTVNVTAVVTAGTITTKDFTLGKDRNIEGTYTGDVKSFRVTIDGTTYRGGTINASNKTYAFYALDKISKTGTFTIEGLDASGKVLNTKTGTIVSTPGTGTVAANAFTIHRDITVTGTVTGDVKSLGLVYDGKEYRGGTLNSNGTYSFYALNTITDKTKSAVMYGYDRFGNRIATSTLTLRDAHDIGTGTVAANPFVIDRDKTITGQYTGDVKSFSVTVGGVEYRGGTLNSDGTFSFYAWDKIKNTTDPVVMYGLDKNGNRISTTSIRVTKASAPLTKGNVTADVFTVGEDKFMTGNYTEDVKSFKVTINGTVYTGGMISEGRFNFWIGDKIKSASDTVTIAALDRTGRELDSKAVQLVAATPAVGTVTPATFSLKTSSVTGSYTGEAKSVRLNVNGTVLPAGGSVSGGNFSYYVGLKNKVKATSDDVKIELLDKNGLVMDTKSVTVTN